MHRRTVTRADFPGLYVAIFGEVREHFEILIRHVTRRGDGIVLLHRQHHIRLTNIPTVAILRSRRQVRRLPFGRAGRHPPGNRRLLLGRQAARIEKRAVLRIGCHGGMVPSATLVAIAFAHGRASL